MSDWLRAFSILPVLSLALICAAWAVGGWLLVRGLFSLRPGEGLLTGVATGFVLYLEGLNLLAHGLSVDQACWAAALIILLGGMVAVWRSRISLAELRRDLSGWLQLLALLFLVFVFMTVKRGVSMYDDTTHLPLVSVMGTGDIPPHFYLFPPVYFAYHYGLQIFAAALESVGRFFPWSAWDMARAAAIALTMALGWVWARRFTRRSTAGVLGSFLFVFGGGTRWLMLLLPDSVMAWVNSGVQTAFSGRDTASTLIKALTHPYVIEGSGSMPFAFAFQNGVFEPVFFNLGATGALPFLTVLLLLLLSQTIPSIKRPWALVVVALVFANLALSAEHIFAAWWGALVVVLLLAAGLRAARRARAGPLGRDEWLAWVFILAGSALLALVQGGYVTETVRSILVPAASQNTNVYGFGLRWPPGAVDGHFGTLSLFDPRQLLALLLEMGPALLLAPLASVWAWKTARAGQRWQASLGLAAVFCFIFPLFVKYGVDRNSARFTEAALWIWLVLAFPALAFFYRSFRPFWKGAAAAAYGICVVGGIFIFATMIDNVPAPRLADFIHPLDLSFTRAYWDQLEPDAQVLDATPMRAVTVFGRASLAWADQYTPLPAWTALVQAPLPARVSAGGYAYIYMSYEWWETLKPDVRAALQQPCVILVKEIKAADSDDFRRLLDVRACR